MWLLWKRNWRRPELILLLFPFCYAAYSALLMVESRYGFPLVPFGLMAGVLAVQQALAAKGPVRRIALLGLLLLMTLFWSQTLQWDWNDDVVPHISLREMTKNN